MCPNIKMKLIVVAALLAGFASAENGGGTMSYLDRIDVVPILSCAEMRAFDEVSERYEATKSLGAGISMIGNERHWQSIKLYFINKGTLEEDESKWRIEPEALADARFTPPGSDSNRLIIDGCCIVVDTRVELVEGSEDGKKTVSLPSGPCRAKQSVYIMHAPVARNGNGKALLREFRAREPVLDECNVADLMGLDNELDRERGEEGEQNTSVIWKILTPWTWASSWRVDNVKKMAPKLIALGQKMETMGKEMVQAGEMTKPLGNEMIAMGVKMREMGPTMARGQPEKPRKESRAKSRPKPASESQKELSVKKRSRSKGPR